MLLRLISLPHLRTHALRTALTTAGISLGVAVFVSLNSANQSVLTAFSQTIDQIAGKTELQVSAGETGFSEDVLETVQSDPTVGVAVPVIEAVADTKIRGEGSLLVLGVDFTGDRTLREYDLESADDALVDDPLVFLAQPDSIILSSTFAGNNGLEVGSEVPLGTADGERRFTVRGIMKPGGLTSAFGGNLAIMDIYAAQKMFGRGRTFDRIDIAVAPDSTLDKTQRALAERLGPGFQVETPSNRSQHFEAMIAAYSVMMRASSLFAMFIGMFIIYNAFSIAVSERRTEIGILRALGATRGQVQRLFLAESALAGLMGSVIGLGAGLLIARATATAMGSLITGVSGVAQSRGDIVIEPSFLLTALAAGILTSMAAAFIPARSGARTDPVRALQRGKFQTLSAAESRWRAAAALAIGALSLGCLVFGTSRPVFYASFIFIIIVAVLLTPSLCLWLSKAIRPLLRLARPVEGTLAADSLVQAPRRTSACAAALMLSLALVIGFAGMAQASFESITDWATTVLNPDVFVLASPEATTRTIRFPATMAPELAAIPGVARVQMVRQARILFAGKPVMLMALQFSSMAETSNLKITDGDREEIFRKTGAGEAVVISENLAGIRGLKRGDMLDLPTPGGTITRPIVGIIVDYVDQQGVILIDRALYQRYWQDDSVNAFRVYFAPGAQLADVKRRILERYAGERQVFVLANDEMKAFILRIAGQWFRLTYVQIAIAVIVAILGIVNTLTVSITDRRREIGVLRAVGGLDAQIKRTVWLEAIGIAVLGLILGAALGAVTLYYVLQIVQQDVIGMRFPYEFPIPTALLLVPTMLIAAFVAAVWPARIAMRGSLTEALSYE